MATHYMSGTTPGSDCGMSYADVMTDGGWDSMPTCPQCRIAAVRSEAFVEYSRHLGAMMTILAAPPNLAFSSFIVRPGCPELARFEQHARDLMSELQKYREAQNG